MAVYIPHRIFHLARLLYVRPETFGPTTYFLYLVLSYFRIFDTQETLCSVFSSNIQETIHILCDTIRLSLEAKSVSVLKTE